MCERSKHISIVNGANIVVKKRDISTKTVPPFVCTCKLNIDCTSAYLGGAVKLYSLTSNSV